MDQDEYLELVDENDNVVGKKKRSEIYAEHLSNFRLWFGVYRGGGVFHSARGYILGRSSRLPESPRLAGIFGI